MKQKYLFLILVFLFSAVQFYAQTTGKVVGQITDAKTQEPIPFANVLIVGSSMGAASDFDGYFTIVNVPPGTYTLRASVVGYNAQNVSNVRVTVNNTTVVDFSLPEESYTTAEVTVIATRPLVEKGKTSTAIAVDDKLIADLPVNNIGDVLSLQAGLVKGQGGEFHMRGGRANQINYTIDGVPVNDAFDGSSVVDVNSGAVQELQVVSGAFNAEYGQALSGVVNIVTKDGSNEFKGSVSSYIGDYVSNRTDIFWNIDDLNPVAIKNFEGSFSGPIIPDVMHFFINGRYTSNEGHLYGRNDFLPNTVFTTLLGANNQAGQYLVDLNKYDVALGNKLYDAAGNLNPMVLKNADGQIVTQELFQTKPFYTGDRSFVSMNPDDRYYAQGKLTTSLFQGFRVMYNYMFDYREYKDYNGNRLTPENNLQRFSKSHTNIAQINHAFGQTFYTLSGSYAFKDYRHYMFENVFESDGSTKYVNSNMIAGYTSSNGTPVFGIGGTSNNRFTRNTSTIGIKGDMTSQLTREIALQGGFDYKKHRIFFDDLELRPQDRFNVLVPPITSVDHDQYLKNPVEIAGYVQTKIEAYDLIINAGLRFDYFMPDGQILNDPSDPNILDPIKPANRFNDANGNGVQDAGETVKTVADREKYWFKDASDKSQFSPRIGIAFPITEKGVIHLSYGHFFQLPRYEFLYENPEFELNSTSGNVGRLGNADLNPQKTVKGEIGLQQALSDDMVIDVTVFFEDFRDLVGTASEEVKTAMPGQTYTLIKNSDFGFSKGFIIKFEKRLGDGFSVNLDYTYSETKGNSSDPRGSFIKLPGSDMPETFIRRLSWDQPHTLNLAVNYSDPGAFGVSLIGNIYAGQPYTPTLNKYSSIGGDFPANSGDKQTVFNFDMRLYKDIMIGNTRLSLFAKVFNLFDFENANNVYGDTGDPFETQAKTDYRNRGLVGNELNTVDEIYTNPTFFASPRRVEVGFSYNF